MANLKDSGERSVFSSGAQREMEGKGRHDLLPLDVLAVLYESHPSLNRDDQAYAGNVFTELHNFVYTGDTKIIVEIIWSFIAVAYAKDPEHAITSLAIHYADGASKYAERNWEKGIKLSSFLSSAVRHFIKWLEHWEDEPHDRAFMWNLFGILRVMTSMCRPELYDLPFSNQEDAKHE